MTFHKYMHLERLGTNEVDGIEVGTCHVFPKLDGTNASIWLDSEGNLKAGSRNRELSLEKDNAGFYQWVLDNEDWFKGFFKDSPTCTLYGEWLVPHSLKTYEDDAWRRFYIFDVFCRIQQSYLPYVEYKLAMDEHGFDYLAPIAIVRNGSDEDFEKCLEKNTHFIKQGMGVGEGVVIKNYSWQNDFGRVVWAKLITNTFKEKHHKEMGAPEVGQTTTEERIAEEFVTQHLVDKVYAKIQNEDGWSSKMIGKLLGVVWHDLITEEIWEIIKKYKNPKIDFKRLQRYTTQRIKGLKPELF